MEAEPARIIRTLAEACRLEGLFPLQAEDTPLIVDAYRTAGASEHEMWVAGLIGDSDHARETCPDPFCSLRDEDAGDDPF